MTFKLWIEEAIEVHRDPCGHYHHWTILVCRLKNGILNQGPVLFTTHEGERYVSKLVAGNIGILSGKPVTFPSTAEDIDDQILEIMVSFPAVKGPPLKDTWATDCSPEVFREVINEMLVRDPALFFHYEGGNDQDRCTRPCGECSRALHELPEDIYQQKLEALTQHPKKGVAYSAKRHLDRLRTREDDKQV